MAPSPRPRSTHRMGLALCFAVAMLPSWVRPVRAGDADWPRRFESASGAFVVFQPQPESLNGDLLSCRTAFSLLKGGQQNPVFGVIWFTERLQIDRDSSTVNGRNFDVTRVRLPGITTSEARRYEQVVEDEAKQWDLSGSLEDLQAGLAASEKERASVAEIGTSPPRIVFAYQRSILVQYDGDPALEPIEGTGLQRVANTPYAVIYDPAAGDYYLSGAHLWYTSRDPLDHWREIPEPPPAVESAVPPDTSSADQVQGEPPAVITATEPTELISIDGQPDFAPLVDGDLLYVTNTESDVVREVSTQAIYVLLAGRWYRAASPDGPWSYVRGDQLPESFRHVPADSPKGEILAAVAGTDQADNAVADAEIPQTSAIRRDSADFQVAYDQDPQFEPIHGTNLQYALNTDAQVILADGRYYACDQGVWYVSDQAEGPWSVSETRPVEVDDIPPDCPVYNTRYVYIYDSTPDAVYMGYLPGYLGCFPYYGTVVYGTGYHYRPWRGRHHYFPRPSTWGFCARYNPWLSRWSFGYSYGTGFLRVGYRWSREPHPGGFRSPPLWFGPGGYHRPLLGPDRTPMRTRRDLRERQRTSDLLPANVYNRSTNLRRVDRAATRMPSNGVRPFTPRPASSPNNVLAGRDGRVYQRDARGRWQVNQGTRWVPAHGLTRAPAASGRARATPAPARGRGTAPPALRPFPAPAPPQVRPHVEPPPRPAPPPISKDPGDLEREYHAREQTGSVKRPQAPPPAGRNRSPDASPPAHAPSRSASSRTARPEPTQKEQPKEKGSRDR